MFTDDQMVSLSMMTTTTTTTSLLSLFFGWPFLESPKISQVYQHFITGAKIIDYREPLGLLFIEKSKSNCKFLLKHFKLSLAYLQQNKISFIPTLILKYIITLLIPS